MSEERQETVADIMSEMREYADSMEKHLIYDLSECSTDYLRVLADRIEAAEKREREATRENYSQVGNEEKMLEALQKIVLLTVKAGMSIRFDVACGIIASTARCALAAPPRNCDVGTADAQVSRYNKFCMQRACSECPFYVASDLLACGVRWAQTTYEESK